MWPDDFLVVFLVIAIAAAPLVILGLLIVVLRRQARDRRDVSHRLDRIERDVDRTLDMVRQLAEGAEAVPSLEKRPPAPVPEPKEKIVQPELAAKPSQAPWWSPEPVPPAGVEAVLAEYAAEPSEPALPRQPSRFETAAKDVLWKIWNWIIVGEEHVPEGRLEGVRHRQQLAAPRRAC